MVSMVDLRVLYRDLINFEIELWNAIDAALRDAVDLPLTWFEVLHLLGRRSECRVQDIAEEFAITVGGTSKVVDRIVAAGYCERRANPNDRRSSIIELTPAGRELLDRAVVVFDGELADRVGSVLSEPELERFAAALRRFRAAGRCSDVGGGRGQVGVGDDAAERGPADR
jgi:DNA-binding MarR family transcriptional regulator